MTDQGAGTSKVRLGEPGSFTRVTYRKMGEGLFTAAQMTQRWLTHHSPPQNT